MAKRHFHETDRDLAKAMKSSKVPAISRAAAMLRLLGRSSVPLGVHEIARELGVVPSSCLYSLRALVAENFVAFYPDTKRYSLEVGILTLGQNWLMRNRFNDIAQPKLDAIARDFDVTVFGVQILGLDHIVVVAVSQSTSNSQLSVHIGSRFPALISATGRCIAAFGGYPEDELQERFKSLRWAKPLSYEEWSAQVRWTGANGFGMDEDNHKTGETFVGAPVWNAEERLSHCIVATGITDVLRDKGLPNLQQAVVSAARHISDKLSGGISAVTDTSL